jgi:aspartate kinase
MKFGGTGVNSGAKVREVAQLVKSQLSLGNEIVAVVSAIRGMTDDTLSIAERIRDGQRVSIEEFMKSTRGTHRDILHDAITNKTILNKAESLITQILDELENVLGGIIFLAEVTPKTQDYLLSFGERLSTPIVSYTLQDIGVASQHLTGKEAGIVTDSNFGDARPLMDTTKLRVGLKITPMLANKVVPVITGFIGADQHGITTTIGRGGSDYTATLIASSIQANEVWLWSDVNGLMTADPKIVNDAQVLKEVSFTEALEMALFGAKYIHPRSFYPVIESNIPIRIRNALNVDHQGTVITTSPAKSSQKIVKSISAIRKTSLIDVSGGDMAGSPGTASRIFEILARNKVNIMMISQSPSESSISMIVRKGDLDRATTALELNLLGKIIKKINVIENVAIIAIVGSGMRGIKGVASKIFGAVARKDVNVIMIVQGSSELNLAFVVNDDDCEKTVRALHEEFKLGATK